MLQLLAVSFMMHSHTSLEHGYMSHPFKELRLKLVEQLCPSKSKWLDPRYFRFLDDMLTGATPGSGSLPE